LHAVLQVIQMLEKTHSEALQQALAQVEAIKAKLLEDAGNVSWSTTGSLQHVNEELSALSNFLGV